MVILVPEPIADSADIAPGKTGAQHLSLITQPDRRFADHLQLAFDRCYGFCVGAECLRIHALSKMLDRGYRMGNVTEGK